MTGADKQQDALEVLKSFNAAVTTTKLYPPSFPQVANAVDDAFQRMTGFLDSYGKINFSVIKGEPNLCGFPVKEKTLGKQHGEAIYQQLNLLNLDHMVVEKNLYEALFMQLITFFTTSPQLVTKEGGGRSFVVNLGLNDLFPEEFTIELPDSRDDLFAEVLSSLIKESKVKIEHIQDIAGDIDAETIDGQNRISSLFDLKKEPMNLANLIVAAIANLLKGSRRKGELNFPPSFITVLRNADRVIKEEERAEITELTITLFLEVLDNFSLHILYLQTFPSGFGEELFNRMVGAKKDDFHEIVALIREAKKIVANDIGKTSKTYRSIIAGSERVFATPIGKQFLVREKAKKLLEEGEKERQAKRIQAGISGILKGDLKALRSKEVIEQIPSAVETLISRGKDSAAAAIIENITTELIKEDLAVHDELSKSLSLIGESLVNTEKWDWLHKLSVPMMAWVKKANRADEVLENIIEILQKLIKYYWKNDRDEKADKILQIFFAIRTGKLQKSSGVVDMVGRVQDLTVEKGQLIELLARSVAEKNELVDRRLVMQGSRSTRFLLNTLFESVTTEERLKILELLVLTGPLLPPLLLEKLAEPMPWYGKRNLIKLLSETGSRKEANQIFDYLNHEDIRVQQETLLCICKLSGEDTVTNLIEALSLASGPMKGQVLKALEPIADEEVVASVANFLGDWQHFADEIRDPLIKQIAKLLGKGASKTAEEALADFLQHEGKTKIKVEKTSWQAARQAHRKIKSVQRELSKREIRETVEAKDSAAEDVDESESLQTTKRRRTSYAEEDHVEALLEEGDVDRAKKLLVDLVGRACSVRQFSEAEKLREWLIDIDPSALSDIIRTAEAIEDAKKGGISNDYLRIWSELNDNLSTEEFNALYYSMEHLTVSDEGVLVKQGDMQPSLFFVNQGKVKIYFNDKSSEVLIKVVEPGEIFGSDTFFDASVWTFNAAPLSRAEVSVLPLKNTHNWGNDHPSLESKIQEFSKKYEDLSQHLRKDNKNRREHERHKISGTVVASILEKDGKESGVKMKGDLSDISMGGASFSLRISQRKNARILLGRTIRLEMESSNALGNSLQLEGVLLTVRSLYSMNNEYSAHVRFTKVLSRGEMHGVIEANSQSKG